MNSFRVMLVTGVACAALVAACAPTPRAVPIDIKGFVYSPAAAAVHKGDTLVFTNHDFVQHTATGRNFDTGAIQPKESKRVVVTDSSSYICALHPNMHGQIRVE